MLQWSAFTYWSGLPVDGFEIFIRPDRGWAAIGTNDGLTMLVVGWPYAESQAYKADVEGNYLRTLELVPEFADRVRAATREERFSGGSVPNFFRRPYGPGWVLVGDAGYNKDPITAQGISDAFHDAERCSTALDEVFAGGRPFDAAMADYHRPARRPRPADLRVHDAAGDARAAAARDPAAPRRHPRQPRGHGRLRQHHRRHGLPAGVLRPANIGRLMGRRRGRLNDLLDLTRPQGRQRLVSIASKGWPQAQV